MRRAIALGLLVTACRNLAPSTSIPITRPPQPGVPPLNTRESLPGNRCGIECGVGFHCDQGSASCVADRFERPTRDAGPAWLP